MKFPKLTFLTGSFTRGLGTLIFSKVSKCTQSYSHAIMDTRFNYTFLLCTYNDSTLLIDSLTSPVCFLTVATNVLRYFNKLLVVAVPTPSRSQMTRAKANKEKQSETNTQSGQGKQKEKRKGTAY